MPTIAPEDLRYSRTLRFTKAGAPTALIIAGDQTAKYLQMCAQENGLFAKCLPIPELKKASTKQADLIVVDTDTKPNSQVADTLRSFRKHSKFLILLDKKFAADWAEAIQLQKSEIMAKPLARIELVGRINELLAYRMAEAHSGVSYGPRLGGTAPEKFDSARLNKSMQYFLSFPLKTSPDLHASVFLTNDTCSFFDDRNMLHSDDRLIVIPHSPQPSGKLKKYASIFNPCAIVVGEQTLDTRDDGLPEAGHKIGGAPYCTNEKEFTAGMELLRRGYLHVLQLDFPGPGENISGSWPFGEGIFNLFWEPPFKSGKYLWCVQS
jgi:hypothetical protein